MRLEEVRHVIRDRFVHLGRLPRHFVMRRSDDLGRRNALPTRPNHLQRCNLLRRQHVGGDFWRERVPNDLTRPASFCPAGPVGRLKIAKKRVRFARDWS